mmetsp:Transcript_29582/g.114148  ORF Transcript_29582/g.114148 Transcript_29582/m.114148 type:complete len:90 (+) Transcript_29582:99-368(+)
MLGPDSSEDENSELVLGFDCSSTRGFSMRTPLRFEPINLLEPNPETSETLRTLVIICSPQFPEAAVRCALFVALYLVLHCLPVETMNQR